MTGNISKNKTLTGNIGSTSAGTFSGQMSGSGSGSGTSDMQGVDTATAKTTVNNRMHTVSVDVDTEVIATREFVDKSITEKAIKSLIINDKTIGVDHDSATAEVTIALDGGAVDSAEEAPADPGTGGQNAVVVTDHALLKNRNLPGQHTIAAITGLRGELDGKQPKLPSTGSADEFKAIQIDENGNVKYGNVSLGTKASGLYYDTNGDLDPEKKPHWYLTAETAKLSDGDNYGLGTKESVISGPYDLGSGSGSGTGGGSSVTDLTITNINPETDKSMWPAAVSAGASCTLRIY